MKLLWLIYKQVKGVHVSIWLIWLLAILFLVITYEIKMIRRESNASIQLKRHALLIKGLSLGLWIFMVLDITVFQDKSDATGLVIVPFDPASWLQSSDIGGFHERRILNALLNLSLFLPGGMVAGLFEKCRSSRAVLPILAFFFAFAVAIEVVQFILSSGMVIVDVVLFRCVGGLLGWLLINCVVHIRNRLQP